MERTIMTTPASFQRCKYTKSFQYNNNIIIKIIIKLIQPTPYKMTLKNVLSRFCPGKKEEMGLTRRVKPISFLKVGVTRDYVPYIAHIIYSSSTL